MKVILEHKEVVEACREWLEKHYGIKIPDGEDPAVYAAHVGQLNLPEAREVRVSFGNAPKPQKPPTGPYR